MTEYLVGALAALVTIAAFVGGFFVAQMSKTDTPPRLPSISKGRTVVMDSGVYIDEVPEG